MLRGVRRLLKAETPFCKHQYPYWSILSIVQTWVATEAPSYLATICSSQGYVHWQIGLSRRLVDVTDRNLWNASHQMYLSKAHAYLDHSTQGSVT